MLTVLAGFVLTLIAFILGKIGFRYLPQIPVIVTAMIWVIILLWLVNWHYEDYMANVQPYFDHLLGYVTVALAIPLAAMRFDDLPLKPMIGILAFASISAVALPMGLAYLLHLAEPTILAFATRAVTTPVALNIATLLHAPLAMVSLIVILSGVIGAAFSPWILRHVRCKHGNVVQLQGVMLLLAWQSMPYLLRYGYRFYFIHCNKSH